MGPTDLEELVVTQGGLLLLTSQGMSITLPVVKGKCKIQMTKVKCQVSDVRCQMSNVKCHVISMSNVKCHGMSNVFCQISRSCEISVDLVRSQ